MKKIVFAVDPGSGSKSACGICIYDPNSDEILATFELRPSLQKPTWRRLLDIMTQLRAHIVGAVKLYGPLEIRTECFVMRGKGGETLARLVGGLIAHIPWECDFVEVHNIILKVDLTGNSRADKSEIGEALKKRFSLRPASLDAVCKLVENDNWDALDAIAIAVCRRVQQ